MPVHHQAQGPGDVTVHKIPDMGSLSNNGYIVICPETNQAVCIDTPDEPEKMINEVRESGVEVQAILVTHGHGDHLAGYTEITGTIGAPAAIGDEDAHLPPSQPQRRLNDGDTVQFGNRTIQVHPHAGPHRRLHLLPGGRFSILRRHPVPRRPRDAPAAPRP